MNKSQFFMIDLPCSDTGHPDSFKLFHFFQKMLLGQLLTFKSRASSI